MERANKEAKQQAKEQAKRAKEQEERARKEAEEAEKRARKEAEQAKEQAKREAEEAKRAKEQEERARKEAEEAEKRARKEAEQQAKEQAKREAEEAKRAKEQEERVRKEAEEAEKTTEDTGVKTYEGEVKLVLPSQTGFEKVQQFEKQLKQVENLKIAWTGGSQDEGAIISVSLQKPMNLIDILNEMPMVEKVNKKGGKLMVTLESPTAS